MSKKLIALLTASIMIFSACSLIPKEEKLPDAPVLHTAQNTTYTQVAVARGNLVKKETVQCQFESALEQNLQFTQTGEIIAHIYVQKGDTVHAGDLIAELDNTQILQELENQNLVIVQLNLQISQAKENLALLQKRISVLKTASEKNPQKYSSEVQAAEQTLADRESNLEYLNSLHSIEQQRLNEIRNRLSTRQLRAEIDGNVRFVQQNEGKNDLISNAGQTVCTISDLSSASFTTQTEKGMFSAGNTVSILYDDTEHEATVAEISAGEKDKETVRFQLALPDASLSAGKQAKISVVTASKENVLYLPSKAVISVQNARMVYYVDENGIKNSKTITTGIEADGKTEIIDGLKEGELVIQ